MLSLQPDAYTLQRKKSLPDVQDLVGVTAQQSSQEMTREEISVLSSARRDNVRRQMEEIERYKSNPIMYILNPRVQVREHQQQQGQHYAAEEPTLEDKSQLYNNVVAAAERNPLLTVTASCVAHLLTLEQIPFVDDDDNDDQVSACDDSRQYEDLEVD